MIRMTNKQRQQIEIKIVKIVSFKVHEAFFKNFLFSFCSDKDLCTLLQFHLTNMTTLKQKLF